MQLHSTQAVTPSSYPAHSIFIPTIPSPSSPQPTLRSHISRCRRYLRNLQPETLVLLPAPCMPCDPPLLDVPAVRHIDGGDPQRSVSEHGGCESPCPDLDEDESPIDTDETSLSSEDEYEPFPHLLQSVGTVCDLTRSMVLERRFLRNSIAQKDRLRADLLRHAKNILDTLDDDLYLLYQARYHLDDLIKGFSESRPRDQTSPSA